MGWAIYIIMIQDGGRVANGQARRPQGCASPSAITKVKYYPCQRLIFGWVWIPRDRLAASTDGSPLSVLCSSFCSCTTSMD